MSDARHTLAALAWAHLTHMDEAEILLWCPYCWHEAQDADAAMKWADLRARQLLAV